MVLSSDFTITDVNPSVLKIYGYNRDEMIGLNSLLLLGNDYKSAINIPEEQSRKQEALSDLLINTTKKAGERLVMKSQTVDISYDEKHQYLVVLKDVTEETIANEALTKNEKLYRTIFEETSDAILLMRGPKVIEHNRVAKELYPDLIKGKNDSIPFTNLNQIMHKQNESVNFAEKISMALKGQPQVFEWIHTNNSKAPIHTLISIKAIKELGMSYYTIVERNITDRKRSQNLVLNSVIQTEENERKRISSDLHDGIGPILTTIKLYAQALVDAPNTDKQLVIKSRLIDTVEEAVNSISEISFNISPHILVNHGIVAAVEAFISKFNLRQEFDFAFTHNGIGRFDENKEITIYRLFTELVNNTIKHAEASRVEFNIFETDAEIDLHYKDNGKGFNTQNISPDTLRMGLGNLKNRIQSFNGQFAIKSQPNKGVKVFIKLPKTENV